MRRARLLSLSTLAGLALLLVALSASPAGLDPRRAALRGEVERLRLIQSRHEAALLGLPGVHGMGTCLDAALKWPVFVVVVGEGGPLPPVPATIEGVPVRVERRPPLRLHNGAPGCAAPCHANLQPPPVRMGNSGGWELGGACTLGFKACDLGTGRMVFVTNSHCNTFPGTCQQPELGNLGWRHPGPQDDPAGSGYDIGDISGHAAPSCGSNNNLTDATKVDSPSTLTSIAVRDVDYLYAAPGDPLPGDPVQKSGRTTGLTTGEIDCVNFTVDVPEGAFCCGALTMKQQIRWQGDDANDFGDSGSALLSTGAEPRVLGLHWAGDGEVGYANHVDNVLAALNLTLNLVTCVEDCLFSRAAQGTPDEAGLLELGHRFRDQVLQRSAVGRRMTQAFYQYSDQAVLAALRSPSLLAATRQALLDYTPVLQSLVVNGRAQVGIADLDRVDRLLADYTVGASAAMRGEIQWLRSQIRDPRVQAALGVRVK